MLYVQGIWAREQGMPEEEDKSCRDWDGARARGESFGKRRCPRVTPGPSSAATKLPETETEPEPEYADLHFMDIEIAEGLDGDEGTAG